MKLSLLCEKCMLENGKSKNYDLHIPDDRVCKFTCELGHINNAAIMGLKYEILYKSAEEAYEMEYYAESFLCYIGALESFRYEIVCLILDVNEPENDPVTKILKKHSERALGAFESLILLKFCKHPPEVDNKIVNIRNKIIHQGVITDSELTLKYKEFVKSYIRETIKILDEETKLRLLEKADYGFTEENVSFFGLGASEVSPAFEIFEEEK